MNRNRLLAALVCANLVLLFCFAAFALSPRTALAQETGLAGNYLMVTGEVQEGYDVLYMIDMKSRLLHSFYYDRTARQLQYMDRANLDKDFRNNKD